MLDEDALCALMLNLHQQGRTSEGLRLYEETKMLLEREGLAPTETTRMAEQQLRTGLPLLNNLQQVPDMQHRGGQETGFSLAPLHSSKHNFPPEESNFVQRALPGKEESIYTQSQLSRVDPKMMKVQTLEDGIHFMKESRRYLLQHLLHFVEGTSIAQYMLSKASYSESLAELSTRLIGKGNTTLAYLETITQSHWQLFAHTSAKSAS